MIDRFSEEEGRSLTQFYENEAYPGYSEESKALLEKRVSEYRVKLVAELDRLVEEDVPQFTELIREREGDNIELWKVQGYMKNLVQYLFDRQSYKIYREMLENAVALHNEDIPRLLKAHFKTSQ
mmetsp:Transcript_14471/g.24708  ORF Transcript_14471/g.24708 Transcript_14471/m.24708 type:complete len:124 (-) Transcript_14471:199-570(-)|eukprot:CAMPEP_0168627242 /NCGR_PEP_ID=MMETSP0449_2-20121227/11120_1 /TAXON_ID=1082188 /ORGANISM="Strombidium rassoulzadegani, Strain ras09" /LENGTH=123 /DNA_ID=CAMNT_0008669409 /DNA_START=221 /DNA_END=592 /DNA_ORIENTATION=-